MRGFTDFYYIVVNNTMIKEIWKTVVIDGVEHPRYMVSNLGRVKCLNWNRTGKPRLCRLSDSYGYLMVKIDGVTKSVHRIVAETFIPNPEHKPFIDHIDTNRQRNVIEVDENGVPVENSTLTNIRWATRLENNNNPLTRKHYSENAGKSMLGKFGAEHNRSIQIIQLTLGGQFIRKWSCASEVERELGIRHEYISACCRGKRKSAGGYRWIYASDYKPPRRLYISDIKALF